MSDSNQHCICNFRMAVVAVVKTRHDSQEEPLQLEKAMAAAACIMAASSLVDVCCHSIVAINIA